MWRSYFFRSIFDYTDVEDMNWVYTYEDIVNPCRGV